MARPDTCDLLHFKQRKRKVSLDEIMINAKETARQIIEHLPDQATWDDIMYELYVKQKIELGLKAADEGRTLSHEQAKRRLLGDDA